MSKGVKRLVSVVLCLILLTGALAVGGNGLGDWLDAINIKANAVSVDDLNYVINNDEVVITDCNQNASGELIIPDMIDGNPVTGIGNFAFYGCDNLTSITIPYSVTSIGNFAFQWCSGLTNITIPSSVTSLGYIAFYGCYGVESISVDADNQIYHSADNCLIKTESKSLIFGCKNSDIPYDGSVTRIEAGAFYHCTGLTNITIPNSVTSIGNVAFHGCCGLTSITIPDSVTIIDCDAFGGCSGLESIIVDNGNKDYQSKGNCLIDTETGTLISGCKNSIIPDDGSVTSIGDLAFDSCTDLTNITIPNNVTSIGVAAFESCSSLTSITISDSVTDIEEDAFYACCGLYDIYYSGTENDWRLINISDGNDDLICATIHCSDGDIAPSMWEYDFQNNEAVITGCRRVTGDIVIPDIIEGYSVTSIGNYAFASSIGLTSITIPSSITSIGEGAFDACTGLTSVTISDSVMSIGDNAFRGCCGLTSITIPDSVISIGNYAFYDCTGISNITIPGSVTEIGSNAFSGITNVSYNGTASGSPWGAKYHNGYFDGYLVYSDSSKTVLVGCLPSATGAVNIPNSVTSIGDSAFRGCTGLTSITIPDSVTSIGYLAFGSCSSLMDVYYSGSVSEWKAIWNYNNNEDLNFATIHCSDGDIEPNTEPCYTLTFISNGESVLQMTYCEGESFWIETPPVDCGSWWEDENGFTPEDYDYIMPGHDLTFYEICDATSTEPTTPTEPMIDFSNYTEIFESDTKSVSVSAGSFTVLKFVPETTDYYSLYSESSDDTIAYLYDSDGNCLTSNDDGYYDSNFYIEYYMESGETYYYGVGYWSSSNSGSYNVTLSVGRMAVATETEPAEVTPTDAEHIPCEAVMENEVVATCETGGSYDSVIYCSVCGEELSRETVETEALGHNKIHHDAKESTCKEHGWKAYDTCSRCDYTTYEELPLADHTPAAEAVKENKVAATCEKGGRYDSVIYCSVCGEEISRETVNTEALSHSFTNYIYNNDATADSDGTETAKCNRCDATDTRTKPGTQLKAGEVNAVISADKVVRGQTVTWTVTTPDDVVWLRFTNNFTTATGATGSQIISCKYDKTNVGTTLISVTEENGMRVWSVTMPLTYTGTSASANLIFNIDYKRSGSKTWESVNTGDGEGNTVPFTQEVLVVKTADMLIPATPSYEKYTIVSATPDKENGTFTVVTTDDVSKIKIAYTNAETGKGKSLTYQTTSTSVISCESENGLTTWVVKFKFNAPAENNTYTLQARGPAWGEENVVVCD